MQEQTEITDIQPSEPKKDPSKLLLRLPKSLRLTYLSYLGPGILALAALPGCSTANASHSPTESTSQVAAVTTEARRVETTSLSSPLGFKINLPGGWYQMEVKTRTQKDGPTFYTQEFHGPNKSSDPTARLSQNFYIFKNPNSGSAEDFYKEIRENLLTITGNAKTPENRAKLKIAERTFRIPGLGTDAKEFSVFIDKSMFSKGEQGLVDHHVQAIDFIAGGFQWHISCPYVGDLDIFKKIAESFTLT